MASSVNASAAERCELGLEHTVEIGEPIPLTANGASATRAKIIPLTRATSLDVLRAIYRHPMQAISLHLRAPIAVLPFAHRKLAVTT